MALAEQIAWHCPQVKNQEHGRGRNSPQSGTSSGRAGRPERAEKIAASRSGEVLRDVLGLAFNGVLGSFTFLRYKPVDPDNNRAERALRPSVVMRKITYGNNSETGARNHEILMSLVETSKLHNANHLDLMLELATGRMRTPDRINPILFGAISPATGPPPILLKNLHLGGLCAFARE